ncbi:MAG: D-tyrosyl-tRNA(Tyr) deacylase [Thiotrichaceae bacterium]|nr:D-tyrosyl-tRNA(Tyr) deacylase [Thiotrichaceae bacterium]
MIGLIQRVDSASVRVNGEIVGKINKGILLLLGVQKDDDINNAQRLAERIVNYRIFEDCDGKMNQSLLDQQGELLVVPQFTLAANTKKGKRPSFSSSAPPVLAEKLFQAFCSVAKTQIAHPLQTGVFGADMKVELINDGPATFHLES